jgi:hypothetical protein
LITKWGQAAVSGAADGPEQMIKAGIRPGGLASSPGWATLGGPALIAAWDERPCLVRLKALDR